MMPDDDSAFWYTQVCHNTVHGNPHGKHMILKGHSKDDTEDGGVPWGCDLRGCTIGLLRYC